MTKEQLQDAARRMVLYFDPGVLAAYRQEAHRYEVTTDNFEGEVRVRSDFYEGLSEEQRAEHHVTAQFGFRAKADGTLAVAVWAPDVVKKTSEAQQKKWTGFLIPADSFPRDLDARFELWIQRHIAGNWDVEDGPLRRLGRVVVEINALSREALGIPLFRAEQSADLLFPAAENDAAYNAAHSAVYGLIIDGFDKGAVEALAKALGKPVTIERNETMKALKSLIGDNQTQQAVFGPLRVVQANRHRSDHGARPPAQSFPAFDRFSSELGAVVDGLSVLETFLEKALNLDVSRCVERQERLKCLPKLDPARNPAPNYSIVRASNIVGKTVAQVEYGFRKPIARVHNSEVLILHFTDGSVLGIDIGSNAGNLSHTARVVNPEDFHCDLSLIFVPPPRGAATGAQSGDDVTERD